MIRKKKIVQKIIVEIDEKLNQYDNVILFPKKLEKVNKTLKSIGLPK